MTSMGKRLRRPGSPWRLLAHHYVGKQPDGTMYDVSHHVSNTPRRISDGEHSRSHILEDTEFDELVVGSWIHIEQMTTTGWWMNVGGVTINVSADRDGRPHKVDVYGPDDWDSAEPGVKYSLTWSHDDTYTAPESNAPASSPVPAVTEVTGGAGEAQEG
jgi:hypothetical protein